MPVEEGFEPSMDGGRRPAGQLLVGDRPRQRAEVVTPLLAASLQRRRARYANQLGDDRVSTGELGRGGGDADSRHERENVEETDRVRSAGLIPQHLGAPAAGVHLHERVRVDGLGTAIPEAVRVVGRCRWCPCPCPSGP